VNPFDQVSPPVRLHQLLFSFQIDFLNYFTIAILFFFLILYWWAVKKVESKKRHWKKSRIIFHILGILTIFIAVVSGLASYDDSVFTMHVIQHLLLMNAAPILLALSAPITLILQAMNINIRKKAIKIIHSKLVAVLTHPIITATLSIFTMYIYFLTGFYNYSLNHPLVHDATHLWFLTAGCLYWWPVVGLDPIKWRLKYGEKLGYLFVLVPLNAFLGVALVTSNSSISPRHSLSDIHNGGAILWITSEIFTLVAIAIIVVKWINAEHRETLRKEAAEDMLESFQ
jgi:putative membrane protein